MSRYLENHNNLQEILRKPKKPYNIKKKYKNSKETFCLKKYVKQWHEILKHFKTFKNNQKKSQEISIIVKTLWNI